MDAVGRRRLVPDRLLRAHTGSRSGECGDIADAQSSSMAISLNFSMAGSVSFWRRTSSEADYDFLEFYIDDVKRDE